MVCYYIIIIIIIYNECHPDRMFRWAHLLVIYLGTTTAQ